MRVVTATVLLAMVGVVTTRVAFAQAAINYASVSGRVTDAQQSPVPGASVTAKDTETNIVAQTMTNADGRFRFPYLKVGPDEVTVHLDGFKDETRALTLTVGAAFDLPIALGIGGVEANVTVTGQPPVLDTARTQIAGTISRDEARALPMNGRNALDLALLLPGVSPANVGSTQLFAETSAVPGGGLSIGSQRNFSNNFIVDGVSANDDAAGLTGMPTGMDAVEQVQVVTSGGQAELGRALGGYVNVVTKSGTNTAHGTAYDFFRDDRLNAANPLLSPPRALPMHQQQYGLSLGGPIARDRSFYFVNVEQRDLAQSGLTTISQPDAGAINARLAANGYPGVPVATGIYSSPVHSTTAVGKLDDQVSSTDQLSIHYNFYRVRSDNSRGAGGLSAPSASAGLDDADHAAVVSNTWALSDRTVNETRAQFAYGTLKAPPTDAIGPAVSISGVASFGTLSGSPTARLNKMVEIVDTVSHQTGAHAIRAGVDFLDNNDTITFPRSNRGAYSFSSLAAFLSGTYGNAGFTQTFGATRVSQTNPNLGMFLQDEWRAGARLTINAGLRYDLQGLHTIATDPNNVSPRLGLAWTPSASRRTVVRASTGLFFDRVPLRALANALLSAGNTTSLSNLQQVSVSLSPAQAGAPVFPSVLSAAVPSVTLVNFTTMDPHMQNAYSRQGSVEIERQLGASSTVSAGYQYVRGANLIVSVNQNVPRCVAAGNNNGCRPDSTYANDSQYSPSASSTYHGLQVSFVQRPTRWGFYRVSYTLSKAMDNVGEFFFSSPIDPFDLSKDWGRSDDDQRHRLLLSGAVHTATDRATTPWALLTHGFELSGSLQGYSALPLNITSGVTTVQGTTGRPLVNGAFIARNAGTGPDFFTLNLRLSRTFPLRGRAKLAALAEVFNVTNRENVVTLNGNFGAGTYPASPSSNFGQVLAVADPRSGQLGLRVTF